MKNALQTVVKKQLKRKICENQFFFCHGRTTHVMVAEAGGRNIAISGPRLQEKVEQIASELCATNFKASRGWLDNLQKKSNIVYKIMSREK